MARGASGAASSRGRGKFKVSRGGGRHFSRDVTAIDHEMETLGLEDEGSDSNNVSEESEEESSDDGLGGGSSAKQQQQEPEMSRAERKALKKAQGGKKKGGVPAVGDLPENSDEESEEEPLKLPNPKDKKLEPSRREREEAQKKAAAEHYQKMHAAGKTDQFKKDMERLQEVKRRREREAAERKAKEDEAKKEAEDKRQARLAGKR
ncbi:hypothetical protein HD553DRAFT_304921 [Filobasidium floriforme]|uniref:uncharacterized protein n=1 Tax=Filobasidium floriforme TaxID=5210 RepID=UPI001E8CACC2|nr:uncharacterized protein HD553DRAFT_304921 [Filobasidium floriforme]KAH8089004.1 hypothetical protein HD553DRAFT_304921 [Filobasidium floriforme]